MTRRIVVLIASLVTAPTAWGQQAAAPAIPSDALQIALADPAYPVTPGDVYTLSYWRADATITTLLTVGADGMLDMGVFGRARAAGLVFPALRDAVLGRVVAMYSGASPTFTLSSPGAFPVEVSGEVAATRWVTAWGMERLSDVVAVTALPTASLRAVQVTARDGSEHSYDLFRAARTGAADQDPYVKPGDSVTLVRAPVTVRISGSVRRPGPYQLMPGDDIATLVNTYGGGATPDADVARIAVDSFAGGGVLSRAVDLSSATDPAPQLADGDTVRVPSLTDSLPLIYIEGAVITPAGAAASGEPSTPPRIVLRLKQGETLREAVMEAWSSLSPMADLSSASVIRGDGSGVRSVDLRQALFGQDTSGSMTLMPFDRVVIPAARGGPTPARSGPPGASSGSAATLPVVASLLSIIVSIVTAVVLLNRFPAP